MNGGRFVSSDSVVFPNTAHVSKTSKVQEGFLFGSSLFSGIAGAIYVFEWLGQKFNMAESRAKHWCFTLNNYTDQDLQRLHEAFNNDAFNMLYLVYGRETGDSGTPHLQGFVSFSERTRFSTVRNRLGQCHLSVARRITHAIDYCKKDGDFDEFGEPPCNVQGKRTDLELFKEAVKSGMTDLKEIRENHSAVWARYRTFCLEYLGDNTPERVLEDHSLNTWQQELRDLLVLPPSDRTIVFVVDAVGGGGKSWFAHKYQEWHPDKRVQVMQPGKKADMAYALEVGLNVLFVDAPRSKQGEYIQYDFLEDVKNGAVFSTKYESRCKKFAPPHVIVMMNEEPDMLKLSADRYHIISVE